MTFGCLGLVSDIH